MDGDRPALTRSDGSRGGIAPRLLLGAIPVAFLGVFFAWPVAAIVGRGLAPHGTLDLNPVTSVFGDASLRHVAWFTLWQATVSTVLTVALALPGAYFLSRRRFRGRALLRALVTVPFVLPTVVVGAAFTALLGPHGTLDWLGIDGTVWAILAAHVFFNYAVVVRTVGGLWEHLDPRPEEAAHMLGAGPWRVFREVTLPTLRPAIAAGAAIVFLFCFTSFGVILILGGPRFATLETEIYRQTVQRLDLPTAAALSLVQLGAVIAVLVVGGRLRGRRVQALSLQRAEATRRPVRGVRGRGGLVLTLVTMAALLGLPLWVLVTRSLRLPSGGYGLDAYRALARIDRGGALSEPAINAVWTSVRYACIATLVAVVVGAAAAFALAGARGRIARALDHAVMLPLGVSAVTVGFGFLIALDEPPLDLRTSTLIIPIAHAIVAVPFVVRTMLPVLQAIDPRLREAAATLGAPPRRVWREVDLPIVARSLLVGAGFAFAVSLGEFGATLFIVRPDTATLPVVVYRLLGRPGAANYAEAMAASVVLMVLTATALLLIERLRVGTVGEF